MISDVYRGSVKWYPEDTLEVVQRKKFLVGHKVQTEPYWAIGSVTVSTTGGEVKVATVAFKYTHLHKWKN